jgi:CBS domain-containing protein
LRSPYITLRPEDSLSRAAELMESLATRELPVVEQDLLVGILSRTDIEPHRGHWEWTAARTAMTPDPVTVAPDCPITAVARLLLDRGFNSVPVSADGRLLGMIRRSDLLRILSEDGAT